MNMTQWFTYLSFDVMGDLAFGKGFNMLAEAKDQYFLTQLHGNMKAIGLTSHLSWIFPFFKRIPGLNAGHLKNLQWLGEQVDRRIKVHFPRTNQYSSTGAEPLLETESA